MTVMRKLSCAIVLLLSSLFVFANGDPVAEYSALTLARTPIAVHIPEVQLVEENVSFRPCGLYTEVNVRYILVNNSDKDFKKISYGFPIDYEGAGPSWIGAMDMYTESEKEYGWRDSYVRDVNFLLNGKKLQWQCSKDTMIVQPKIVGLDEYTIENYYTFEEAESFWEDTAMWEKLYAKHGDDIVVKSQPIMRRWYYTDLSIWSHAKVELQVTYRVEHSLEMPLYLTANSMIDKRYKESNYCIFEYDFSPASYWGNGLADKFHAQLDVSKIDMWKDEDYNHPQGLDMKRNGDIWTYDATNFNLAEAEPFVLYFSMKPDYMPRPLDRIAEKRIPPSEYTITVSGVDNKYPVSNMSDDNLSTATVLRPGKNDTVVITVSFKDSVELAGLLLYNGYCKSPEVWRNNSRIKEFVPCLYDSESDGFGNLYPVEETLEKPPLAFDRQTLTDEALLCQLFGIFTTKLKIVVTEITPGEKYNDLCVSELIFLRR